MSNVILGHSSGLVNVQDRAEMPDAERRAQFWRVTDGWRTI
jgi:hypothetical protein